MALTDPKKFALVFGFHELFNPVVDDLGREVYDISQFKENEYPVSHNTNLTICADNTDENRYVEFHKIEAGERFVIHHGILVSICGKSMTTGATGPQGEQGPKGDTGPQGEQGPIGPAGSGNMGRDTLDGNPATLRIKRPKESKWSTTLQVRVPSTSTLDSICTSSSSAYDCIEMAPGQFELGDYGGKVDVPPIRFYIGAKTNTFISCTAHVKFDASCTSSLTQDNVGPIDAQISFNYNKNDGKIYVSAILNSSADSEYTAYYLIEEKTI